jgi:hypothetical protein
MEEKIILFIKNSKSTNFADKIDSKFFDKKFVIFSVSIIS